MDSVIGILELIGWIAAVIALAAAITFTVIKLFPGKDEKAAARSADAAR
ncbi:MAG: hypothetical protein L0206_15860 [Actinobacteria bacterium]|nr:hypothetical protein [Actinomycetota bacterium]